MGSEADIREGAFDQGKEIVSETRKLSKRAGNGNHNVQGPSPPLIVLWLIWGTKRRAPLLPKHGFAFRGSVIELLHWQKEREKGFL